jgi:hypothetical protein
MEDFDDTPKAGEDESSFTTVIGDEEKKDFVLFLHPGFDGLPSWRPSSLSVLALLAFHGVQCEHVVSSNDALSRTGELPVLRTPRAVLCNFRDLTRGLKRFVLRSDQPHCDDRLLVDEQAHLFALDEVCHGVLNRLLMRTWWLMSRNRDLVIEPRTIGHLPWIVRERTGTAFVRHLANNVKPRRPLMMEAFDV